VWGLLVSFSFFFVASGSPVMDGIRLMGIDPALYQNPWMLNDIISGYNTGCGTNGFNATPGVSLYLPFLKIL
jgi:hypothetical protein